MSYSFSVQAASKDEAKQKAAAEFDKVVASQPAHAADKESALAAVGAFIDLLTDVPADHHIAVSMYGSVGWHSAEPDKFTAASVGVSAHFADNRWLKKEEQITEQAPQ